jgi:hypothetical protein
MKQAVNDLDEREREKKPPSACPWEFDTFIDGFWPNEPDEPRY